MTLAAAQQTLRANRATFKAKRDGIDWYWSPVRRAWIAVSQVTPGDYSLRLVPGSSCQC